MNIDKERATWQRDSRTFVYLAERRARYASITRNADGRLLILFTHQTEEQEKDGIGDLFLVRRTKDGDWWFYPETIYEATEGEPRAYGTLTTLRTGKLIAPFAELDDRAGKSVTRILSSPDGGESWRVGDPLATAPLVWAAPYGRAVELDDELLMPVFGALSHEDLAATRLCAGLLRSTDCGETWGDWSPIAGPDVKGEVSYEFACVLPLAHGTLLSIVTERRLKKRPELPVDVPLVLVRSYSADGGRNWSAPEHMCVGSWPSLERMDDRTVACSYALWAAWGSMNTMFSQDGFRTIRSNISSVEHNWLPNLPPGEWGSALARDPIALPPVVPNIEGDWSLGHYGFSSAFALDAEHLLIAIGQRQQGTPYTDPPHEVAIPLEKERIETVSVKRVPLAPELPTEPKGTHGKPNGQWKLAERWTVDEWREIADQPPDEVSLVLKSGRWIKVEAEYIIPHSVGSGGRIIGKERGYWVWKSIENMYYETVLRCAYSDDRGATWQDAKVEEPVPLAAAVHGWGGAFEEEDGTVVCPIYGYLNHEDQSVSLYVNALVRSHDGGETWGDWSIVAYDRENRYSAYSEMQLQAFPSGTWVAFSRTENRSYVPYMVNPTSRSVSTDRGRTWSAPEPCAAPGVGTGLLLPDGGYALSAQNTCGWGVAITYDYGQSWNCALPATYVPSRAGVLDEITFWLFDEHGQIVSAYRR